jgi:hypothetical protein
MRVCAWLVRTRTGDIGHRFILRALMDGNETAVLHAIHSNTIYGSYG